MPGIPLFDIRNSEHPDVSEESQVEFTGSRAGSSPVKPVKLKRQQKKRIVFYLVLLISLLSLWGAFSLQKKSLLQKNEIVFLKASCPDFIGRKKHLDLLYNGLIAGRNHKDFYNQIKIKVLWGKGGYGKSELAIEFANRYLSEFSLVWTFSCDNQQQIDRGYHDLAEKLGLGDLQESLGSIKDKVHFYLENHSFDRPWLLIFDNVEEDFIDYPQRGGVILVTSQQKILNPEYHLEVEPFSKEESVGLLKKITQQSQETPMEELAQDLEGIPLLINYAAHYIKSTPGCNVEEYQRLFSANFLEKEGPLWKEMDVNRRYSKSLAASWEFPLKSLQKKDPDALEWLLVCSYLYPENISEDWIEEWMAEKAPFDKSLLKARSRRILQVLLSFGIIRYEEKTRTFSLHRFLQSMIRENRKDHLEKDLASALSLLSNHAKDYTYAEFFSWDLGKIWYSHACEVKKWLLAHQSSFSDSSLRSKEALLYEGMANWCTSNYLYKEALEDNLKVIEIRKSIQGETSLEVGRAQQRAAWVLIKLSRYNEAFNFCSQAEKTLCSFQTENPLDYAAVLLTKGRILDKQGSYEEALKLYEEVLPVHIEKFGEIHGEVGKIQNLMSMCLCKMGRYPEALNLIEKVLKIDLEIYQKHQIFFARDLKDKARILCESGECAKALKFFEQSLSIFIPLRGKKHGDLVYPWEGIGWCYLQLKKYDQARTAFDKALQNALEPYGENASVVIRIYNGLGWSYLNERKVEESLKYFKIELQRSAKIYQNNPKMVINLKDFEKALKEAVQLEGVQEYTQQAAAEIRSLCEELFGKDHPCSNSFKEENIFKNTTS
jgi:tetratricopeptide (TPR) repeat protein